MKYFSNILMMCLVCLFVIGCGASAAMKEQKEQKKQSNADKAIKAVKDLCLAGDQYDLKADAKGNLTFIKLTPGAKVNVSVNVRESSGAAAIFDEKLRKSADQDIRNCIKPYIQRIINAILDDNVSDKNPSHKGDSLPNLLLEIIETQQIRNVRRSYGELAGENFSDHDLNQFIDEDRARRIANDLEHNQDFIYLVLAIKNMNPTTRNSLYKKGYQTYRPTWGELGQIDPQKGQTEAGQEADKMIANAIIQKIQELLLLSNNEIRELLNQ